MAGYATALEQRDFQKARGRFGGAGGEGGNTNGHPPRTRVYARPRARGVEVRSGRPPVRAAERHRHPGSLSPHCQHNGDDRSDRPRTPGDSRTRYTGRKDGTRAAVQARRGRRCRRRTRRPDCRRGAGESSPACQWAARSYRGHVCNPRSRASEHRPLALVHCASSHDSCRLWPQNRERVRLPHIGVRVRRVCIYRPRCTQRCCSPSTLSPQELALASAAVERTRSPSSSISRSSAARVTCCRWTRGTPELTRRTTRDSSLRHAQRAPSPFRAITR